MVESTVCIHWEVSFGGMFRAGVFGVTGRSVGGQVHLVVLRDVFHCSGAVSVMLISLFFILILFLMYILVLEVLRIIWFGFRSNQLLLLEADWQMNCSICWFLFTTFTPVVIVIILPWIRGPFGKFSNHPWHIRSSVISSLLLLLLKALFSSLNAFVHVLHF